MKKQLLKKYFVIFSIAIIIPVLFSYYINYTYSYDRLLNSAIKEHEDMLAQTSRSLDQIFIRAEAIAPQILLNDSIRNIMNEKLISSEAYVYDGDVELSQEYIMSLALNSGFVNEVTLISFKNKLILNSNYFAMGKLDDSFERLAFEFELLNKPSYWDFKGQASKLIGNYSANQIYYTQIVYENFYDPVGLIIISLSDAGIISIIDTILSREEAFIFISDKDGNLIINESIISDSFDMQEYSKNYFETSYVSKNDHLILKNSLSKYNYVLNMVVPMKSIDVDKKQMNLFLIVYMINFIIIVAACFFTAYNIANKFDKINKELNMKDDDFKFSTNEVERIKSHISNMKQRISEEEIHISHAESENLRLVNQIRQNKSNLKRNISYSLLFGGESRRNEVKDKLNDFGLERTGNYIVVLIGFNEYLDSINQIDESLSINVKESIRGFFQANILGFSTACDLFFSDSKDGEKLVAILNLNSRHDYMAEIDNRLKKFCSAIKHDLKVELEISVGSIATDLLAIRHSYQEAYDLQKYQMIMSNSHVLIKGLQKQENINFSINEYRKNLKMLLTMNDMEKIRTSFDTFKETMGENDKFLNFCNEILEEIVKFSTGYKDDYIDDYKDMKDALTTFGDKFKTGSQAIEYLLDKIQIIMFNRNKGTLSQQSQTMINVIAYINDNYHKDISLSHIADIFNISYPYLSKLFKKEMGESFKIYLTKIKIEMSAKLLIRSNESIDKIAFKVGYNSLRQFYTMFKKYQGVTPAIYREKGPN